MSKQKAGKARAFTWSDATCTQYGDGADWSAMLTLPVVESTNALWRTFGGRVVKSKAARADSHAASIVFAKLRPCDRDVSVRVVWYRARKQGDIDNRTKSLLDLLQGSVYANDASVQELRIVRVDDPTEHARMDVYVTAVKALSLQDFYPF